MRHTALLGLAAVVLLLVGVSASAGGAFDQWGYNYKANLFEGFYDNYTKPEPPVAEGDMLQMKWNDAWLNEKGERHKGYPTYIDSGAWLTNHIWYYDANGKKRTYFCKIVAAKSTWTKDGGWWEDADGNLIAPAIWGSFAIIQEVENGLLGKAARPADPGLGNL